MYFIIELQLIFVQSACMLARCHLQFKCSDYSDEAEGILDHTLERKEQQTYYIYN